VIPLLAVVLLLAPVSAEQWAADIDYLAAELPKRHPNPFRYTSRESFNAQLASVKAQAADLSDIEIAIRLQQAVASLKDGHTEVATNIEPMTWFPLRFHVFPDGIYVTKTNDRSRAACGQKLVAIDGVSADEVYARVATTISAENEQWLRARVPVAMARAEVLKTVGVIATTESATFTFERFSLTLSSGPAGPAQALDKSTPDLPLYRRNPELRYWYTWDAAQRLLYLKYNVASNDPADPFVNVEKELLAILEREQVDYFVIDLRDNSGGSTEVARGLINEIRRRTALRGKVFVIIGRKTYSSALLNAFDLDVLGGATLVGEPTGGKPNSYGEVKLFTLPNSKLTVFHSTRHFQLVPGDPPSLEPDVRVNVTAADYFRRRDPVLEAILSPVQISAVGGRRRAVGVGPSCPQ
jgi:hypothetical protein